MSNIAHFFDLNCLIDMNQQAWIVDKNQPNLPLYKIPVSEFKMIQNGIYFKKGNKIDFNGSTYYLPDELWNRLKVLSSKRNINFSNLVISLQEFLNKDLIDDAKFSLKLEPILDLKNKMDDFYIICSKQSKFNYEKIIKKIEEELEYNGIKVNNFYYLNTNFMNQNSDEVEFKKIRLVLQHAIGFKTDGDKFIDDEITRYDMVNFYDKSTKLLNLSSTVKNLMNFMIANTEKGLSDVIKDDLKESTPVLYFHKIQDNQFNPIKTEKIELTMGYLIKKFESFKSSNFYL